MSEAKMKKQKYCQDGKHLPDFLKDFHDQKAIFKTIQQWADGRNSFNDLPNSWVDNQIYTIDYFLWCMALHGYKLQKITAKDIEFLDINTIKENLL
jgi:hypothetical protein